MGHRRSKKRRYYNKKKAQQNTEEMTDFYSRCITESIFYLTPYVILFIVLGFIFS